jgi:hypothetical protein
MNGGQRVHHVAHSHAEHRVALPTTLHRLSEPRYELPNPRLLLVTQQRLKVFGEFDK